MWHDKALDQIVWTPSSVDSTSVFQPNVRSHITYINLAQSPSHPLNRMVEKISSLSRSGANRIVNSVGSGNFGFETKTCGRRTELALESAVKRRLRFVTDLASNLRNAVARRHEGCASQFKS
jgi:hypothetical protein